MSEDRDWRVALESHVHYAIERSVYGAVTSPCLGGVQAAVDEIVDFVMANREAIAKATADGAHDAPHAGSSGPNQ